MRIPSLFIFSALFFAGLSPARSQQRLSLKDAIQTAVNNYRIIKAKAYYTDASKAGIAQAKLEYLPNLNLAAQQDYGTINGQNGPLYGFGGLAAASSGPPLDKQNWNAAFGALYLTNINWDFFAFGRAKARVKTAETIAERDDNDLQQEIFQHKIKVSAAYLNLLAARRLTESYRKNLNRADTFRHVVVTRAKNGLIAGVDSSQANAEVSAARIALIKAQDFEQEQSRQLAVLMGVELHDFIPDSLFVSRIPPGILNPSQSGITTHPLLQWYKSRIAVSEEQTAYLRTLKYPTFTFAGVLQTRGSGFYSNYTLDQMAYTGNYFDGVKPVRTNYLLGIGITWNITQPLRVSQQVKAQKFISRALQEEYEQTSTELKTQLDLSDLKIKNALTNYNEVPVQVKAASDAWLQKSVLYKNGLTNLVDVTQARYALTRAETDRDIAYSNVWQSLLLKAAASGDFNLFISEF